ncbi:FAD-dependent oxidoreductase [Methanolapillus ohkumae]|uniref:CoB--CoM heterodisulfide reductase iron-sulfur subunit A n=1 Tax=Methanolapillus ohkumae TaxID=3028298 RepID=A0AA96V6U0_9EURY|nr:tRNA 5-methylaminomethyl-2-thiouridine biosynthesis bifunctional protein MnmC [Methanosarcinaceae archaeon Am2]
MSSATTNAAGSSVGAVAVIGGGIAGVQSALDLANSGYRVYLIESKPSIGGIMAQLDKTFPTLDCSACILSPKLVEASRHPNIELMTYSEVVGLSGTVGNFKVSVNKKSRYIDTDKCVGCGDCISKCPKKVDDEFEEGLTKRKAIYFQFTQAIPKIVTIDPENCLMIQKGKCGNCKKVCQRDAVNYELQDEIIDINVGAVIMATGFKAFDPKLLEAYRFDHPDVVTALQFERYTNASGPFGGHIQTSKGALPKKIAFVQCIGSRNPEINKAYCSSVCCTYAVKQSRLIKDHHPEVDVAIFNIDLRTFGKGYEEFALRARDEYGVRFINSRPSGVDVKDDGTLYLRYEGPESQVVKEDFDLIVLSVGLATPQSTIDLAQILGVELDKYGFVQTKVESPTETSRAGIFTAGVAQGPKDIPESVAQASGAASKAGALLNSARKTLETAVEIPPENPIDKDLRIGIIVCRCGTNIGSVVDVPAVVEYASALPDVIIAKEEMYSCADDTQGRILEMIRDYKLNRFIVAACTPRTHEPLFQQTCQEAGLNPWLFEFANIREHCSWIHHDNPEKATQKAKDLVRQAAGKVRFYTPLYSQKLSLVHNAVVLGGGVAGLTVANELAANGYEVDLIEKTDKLGGNIRALQSYASILNPMIQNATTSPKIRIHYNSVMEDVSGAVGNFHGKIITEDGGKTTISELDFGVIVIATGGHELRQPGLFGYLENPIVKTQLEFKEMIDKNEGNYKDLVFIQCAGSRNKERPYCSRICCTNSVKNSIQYKEQHPDAEIYILYRDIRTYGMYEEYYTKAREMGVHFLMYDENEPPVVDGNLVKFHDLTTGFDFELAADCVILSAATLAEEGNHEVGPMMKVPLDKNGFFLEVHPKLRPVDFGTDGVFVCGLAQSPKLCEETISQAQAAASRACTILSRDSLESPAEVSRVNIDVCVGCGACRDVCPYHAITLEEQVVTKKGLSFKALRSVINPAACKGCGCCTMACPTGAIEQGHFENTQLLSQVKSVFYFEEEVN